MTVDKSVRAFTVTYPMVLPCDLDLQEIAKEYHDCKQEVESIYTYISDDIAMRSRLGKDS